MLVGEHGRVVPFKYFKELATGVLVLLAVMIAALAVIGFLYVRQDRLVDELRTEVDQALAQAAKFRDEKDLLLAELVLLKKPVSSEPTAKPSDVPKAPQATGQDNPTPAPLAKQPPPPPVAKSETAEKPTPVAWMARISHFETAYDPAGDVLSIKFRIHNATPGRKPLSGRLVVVLADQDNPDMQRVSIPGAALNGSEPLPKQGQAFNVNNYRTMEFKLFNPKIPVPFNNADIYVFSHDGDEILNQAYEFTIEHQETPASSEPAEDDSKAPVDQQPVPEPGADAAELPSQEDASIKSDPADEDPQDPPNSMEMEPTPSSTRNNSL